MAMLQTVTSCSSTIASLSRHNAAKFSNPPASSSLRAEMFGAGIERLRVKQSALDVRRRSPRINALFGLGVPELVVIAGVAALVFGPKKLPEIGKSLGKTVKSFQEAANEFQSELTTDKLEAQKNAESKPDPSTDPSSTKTKENAEV